MAQDTSELWKTLLKTPGTRREYQFDIDGTVYGPDDEVSHNIDNVLYEDFCIGNAVCAKMNLSLFSDDIPRGATIKRSVRLVNEEQASEWKPSGVYFTNRRGSDSGVWTIEAFDGMRKAEKEWVPDQSLEFPLSMPETLAVIASEIGLEIDARTQLNPAYTIDYPATGTTYLQVLQWMAAANGGNFIMSPSGELRLVLAGDLEPEKVTHEVGEDIVSASNNGVMRPISRVTLKVDDENVITAGDDTGMELIADCPYATQEMVDTLLAGFSGYQYQMFSAEAANIDPAAELGDMVEVDGIRSVLAQISDDGSGYPDIAAPGEAEMEEEYPSVGPYTQEFNRKLAQARSYIDKTASELRLGVERLVGGVQILRGTNSMDGLGSGEWSAGAWRAASSGTGTREKIAVSDPPVPGIRSAWRITRAAGNVDVAQDAVPVTEGATYTLSCYARGTGALRMEYGKSPYRDKKFETISGAGWSRYSFTFTVGEEPDGSADGTTNIYVGNSENGALDICGVKLERGLAATDWCLSPEEGGSPPTAGTSLSELRAELELKIGRDENNRIVSMLNASADTIHIKGNRFVLESTNFSVTADGVLTVKSGTIGGWTINNYKICGGTKDTGVAVMQMPSPIVTWVFAAGGTSHDSYADCPFRVSKGGELHATNAYITGNVNATSGNFQSVTIAGSTFSGSLSSATGTFTGSHKSGTVSSCNLGGTSLLVDEGANAWVKVHTAAAKDSIQVHGEGSAVLSAASHAIILGPERVYTDTNFYAEGDISCGGKKSRAIDTEHYGTRCLDAFETPLPTFGDYGTGRLDGSGVCCMVMDPVFMETVDPNYAPTVILTKYGEGDIWYDRDASDHNILVVRGTPGLAFAWQVMYAQTNAEIQRLRVQGYDYKDMSAVVDYESENMVDWEHSPENVDYAEGGAEYLENFERSLEA